MPRSDKKKEARKAMLKELKSMSRDMDYEGMEDKIPASMQKVTVASDSKEGLEKGLEKAQEMMKKRKSMMAKDGGVKRGYEEGYEAEPEIEKRSPKYLSEARKRLKGKYACGGYKKKK